MAQQSLEVRLSITFEGEGMSVTSPPPAGGKVGVPYSHTITIHGGKAPYTWQAVSLPPWMTMQPGFGGASCTIMGTAPTEGTIAPQLLVRDSGIITG